MKALSKIALAITVVMSIASCQSGTDVKQTLSKPEARMEMMHQIADDSTMSGEMMAAMMNSQNGKMTMMNHHAMMMEDNSPMMKMMKDNPAMMHNMMINMMEACTKDTAMMPGMCKAMMGNKEMMDMMHKMQGDNKDMNKMEGMDKKIQH